jgi:prepilin-type N-terminal cleavage/methylation domain-containing protein
MLNRLRHADDGFTLVELLVAIVILAVITVPLADAVIGVLRNQDDTENRLALSHDAQIAASYFAQDVAAVGIRTDLDATGGIHSQSIWRDAAYDAGGQQCGPATITQKVRMLSDNWNGHGSVTTHVVAYYVKPGTTELHRVKCTGSPASAVDVVVAHYVDPNTAVTVDCSSTCEGESGKPVPQQVKLTFKVTLPSVDAYKITLIGERRQT